jgi:GTP-binding protein
MRFIISAARAEQFPPEPEGLAEVAFLGRSNVGKSSLLNALAGQKGLAFTSSQPGRTQVVNFYEVNGRLRLVDLPGYGFARVPQDIRRKWQTLVEQYLLERQSLRLAVLLLDARRGWMETDLQLKAWLEHHNRHYLVVATKVDKLKTQKERSEAARALKQHQPPGDVFECSAVTGRGVRELWQTILKISKNQ